MKSMCALWNYYKKGGKKKMSEQPRRRCASSSYSAGHYKKLQEFPYVPHRKRRPKARQQYWNAKTLFAVEVCKRHIPDEKEIPNSLELPFLFTKKPRLYLMIFRTVDTKKIPSNMCSFLLNNFSRKSVRILSKFSILLNGIICYHF